jgi:hypothetical protein
VTAQADGACKQLALWAAALGDEALSAARALVDGVHHHRAATLELLAQTLQVGLAAVMTQAERALLARS